MYGYNDSESIRRASGYKNNWVYYFLEALGAVFAVKISPLFTLQNFPPPWRMDVSKNNGTPKSSILFWGFPWFSPSNFGGPPLIIGNTHILVQYDWTRLCWEYGYITWVPKKHNRCQLGTIVLDFSKYFFWPKKQQSSRSCLTSLATAQLKFPRTTELKLSKTSGFWLEGFGLVILGAFLDRDGNLSFISFQLPRCGFGFFLLGRLDPHFYGNIYIYLLTHFSNWFEKNIRKFFMKYIYI